MGQTLKGAAKLTSANESKGKLAINPTNQAIINEIIKFAESYASESPEEGKYFFKSPLVWPTNIQPQDLAGDYEQSGDNLTSNAKGKEGEPCLSLKKKAGQYEVSVSSFEHLANVLKAAADKSAETRLCLENNMDPLSNILGERFATVPGPDSAPHRFVDEIIKTKAETEEETATLEEKKCEMNILFRITELDGRLLNEHIIHGKQSHLKRISAADVEHEILVLQNFAGNNPNKHALESISFTEPYTYVYENGCRATRKRQVLGEICYLDVKLHDYELLYITASTSGYFVNKGVDKETGQLDFDDKEGDIKLKLVDLLSEKSEKFSAFFYDKNLMPAEEKPSQVDTTADLDADHDYEQTHTANQQDSTQQQDNEKRVQKSKAKKQEKKTKLEPSIKWKNLELEERKGSDISHKEKRKHKFTRKSPRGKQKSSDPDMDSSFEESSSESEEEEETPDRRNESNADLPSEYWQIQKLVKYLKGGNQTATIIALCSMRDFNLAQETCQLAIRDVGGLEVLINLLDTDDIKCKIGSLKILKEISCNTQIRRAIADLGGLQTMVKILRDQNKDLKCLAAETIANVAKFRRARRTVRQHGGIKKLVALLDCATVTNTSSDDDKGVEVARSGALALWSCSKSTKNKKAMRKAGAIPLLAKLLKSPHENMLIPVVGTLQECASEPNYRLAIRTEGMIEDLVKNLQSDNQELQMHCASAIFKCAEEKETRDLVRHFGGLDPLVSLLSQTENKELLAAATGAIWKCAISAENVQRFQELKAIDMLVALLHDQPEEVLVNVVGALGECAKDPPNRMTIRKAGGIQPLVNLLTGTNQALLVNVNRSVGQCAEEPDSMVVIDKLDGVRLLWSLLKNQNADVQASAAWAICPCIENAKDAGEMVRSFVGGLELIVSLLKSDDKEVLASVCAAIANIANDEENLAVITDHGVVPMLAKLTNTTDDKLRRHLAEAIARCCNWGNNRVAFGEAGAVAPLVKYLKSSDVAVHRSTARALFQLSKDPDNCITMHESGAVKPLMEMVGATDCVLQDAAAGCIANIRRLALANEKSKHK